MKQLLLFFHDPDADVGAHDGALGAAGAGVGVDEYGGVEAAGVDVLGEAHGMAGADGNAQPAAFADGFVDGYGDAVLCFGHDGSFVGGRRNPPFSR